MTQPTKDELEAFALSANGFFGLPTTDQIDYFVFFLTVTKGFSTTQATSVRNCFLLLDLVPYSNISQYLNSNLQGKGKTSPRFLRIKDGFQLHRERKLAIGATLINKPLKAKAKTDLTSLLTQIKNPDENDFLKEAIDCFEIGAYRASIVMVWNLTLDHMYEYVFANELTRFNGVLSNNTDKRIKISSVSKKDDFSEIPESKFVEFCKSSNIITSDIRRILDTKLGIRNTYAHPSSLKVTESKAVEFIEDLVVNIIQKYKV